jgi:hypothetical protein
MSSGSDGDFGTNARSSCPTLISADEGEPNLQAGRANWKKGGSGKGGWGHRGGALALLAAAAGYRHRIALKCRDGDYAMPIITSDALMTAETT